MHQTPPASGGRLMEKGGASGASGRSGFWAAPPFVLPWGIGHLRERLAGVLVVSWASWGTFRTGAAPASMDTATGSTYLLQP